MKRLVAVDPHAFRHLCFAEKPTSWPVSQLYGEIMSPASALQALYNSCVTELTVCQQLGGEISLMHSYLIMCIRSSDPNGLSGLPRVWARCERNFSCDGHSDAASDTISFSVDRPKLRPYGDKAVMECAFDSLKVDHMADLLKIIHDVAPRYDKVDLNHWWFAIIAVGALQKMRTDWTIAPSKETSSKVVAALSKGATRARSQEIARQFANHWHPSSVTPVPVYSYQAWGIPTEPSRPVVPPRKPAAPMPASDPEPPTEEPPSRTASVSNEASTAPSSWSATRFNHGDAVTSVRWIFEEPHELDHAKTSSEPDLVMDLLQEALDDPADRLGTLRKRALRLLQDICWSSDQLPRRVALKPVRNRQFWDSGGEAVIWTGMLEAKKVIVRDARPPEGKDWTSPAGKQVLKLVRRQVIAHLQIHHPNILPLLGTTTGPDHPLSLITPFAEQGHALRFLQSMDRGDRPSAFIRISISIASALHYLHTREPPIIHGDVHARNIVISDDNTPLLCDFGLSRIQHEVTRTSTNIIEGGKYRYVAPELITATSLKFRTSRETDCYAFAMTILEMATLQKPFAEYDNEMSASRAAERGIRPKRISGEDMGDLPKDADDALWALMGRMWCHVPEDRPGLDWAETQLENVASLLQSSGSTY